MDPRCLGEDVVIGETGCAFSPVIQNPRRRPSSPNQDISKRHGTYFPSKASFEDKWNFADDESTWEFPAAVTRLSMSSSGHTSSSSSSTPAQEIALRYRAGMCSVLGSIGNTLAYCDSEYSEFAWERTTSPSNLESVPSLIPSLPDENDVLAIYRQSCPESLALARQEVANILQQEKAHPQDGVACQRPGCRDTLRDAKALIYHLHIHNIDDRSATCPSCQKRFRDANRLKSHSCIGKGNTNLKRPLSPIRESFQRVVRRLSRL